MDILLDTNLLLWALVEPELLPSEALEIVEAAENNVFVSSISIWEIGIKVQVGKLPAIQGLLGGIASQSIEIRNFTADDAMAVSKLASHHRDPFDRALVAQARVGGMKLLTSDRRLLDYSTDASILFFAKD